MTKSLWVVAAAIAPTALSAQSTAPARLSAVGSALGGASPRAVAGDDFN